jgi:hypothetical protein
LSVWSESTKPIGDSEDDEKFLILLKATLLEARSKLDDAIDALERHDGPAYASAITNFSTVRRTASRWLDEL